MEILELESQINVVVSSNPHHMQYAYYTTKIVSRVIPQSAYSQWWIFFTWSSTWLKFLEPKSNNVSRKIKEQKDTSGIENFQPGYGTATMIPLV